MSFHSSLLNLQGNSFLPLSLVQETEASTLSTPPCHTLGSLPGVQEENTAIPPGLEEEEALRKQIGGPICWRVMPDTGVGNETPGQTQDPATEKFYILPGGLWIGSEDNSSNNQSRLPISSLDWE